jgi:hypothetical protein
MLQINPKTHALLLYYLSELPYEEARALRDELQQTYAAYIIEVANYEVLERTIRAKIKTKELAARQGININC